MGLSPIHRKTYKGRYVPGPKYKGNRTNVIYRSSWERAVMKWLDSNSSVVSWSSEETMVPYLCGTDGRMHRYFVDFSIKFSNEKTYLIEVKPKKETLPPKVRKGKRQKTLIAETTSFIKNMSKWKAAKEYAEKRGCTFQVWTEDTLKNLGIKIFN